MSSRFSALRALLVLASICSPVFSLPAASPSPLARRSFNRDYYDNLIYLDSKKSYLYTAVSVGQDTYAVCLNNEWSGLVLYGDQYSGQDSSGNSITIEGQSVHAQDGRTKVGMYDAEFDMEYYHATSWPSGLPKLGVNGVKDGYLGMDLYNPHSPMYSYMSYKWPSDYSKWYYDVLLTYDWKDAKSTDIDFAGVIVVGSTISWTDLLGISSQDANSWGLPPLDKISSQPYIWLRDDGTFYVDNCFWVNGKQTNWNSQVYQAQSGKAVANVYWNERWSMFPDDVVKAMYSWMSGAKYYGESAYGYWQVPCDATISFTFAIDGYKYVLTEEVLIAPNPWGDQCIGSVFTKGQAVSASPKYDIYFGFQYLSSFYYRAGLNHDNNKPYYKLLPLPTPSGGWDNKKYYTAPSYPYTTWKPTYTTAYQSGNKGGQYYEEYKSTEGSWYKPTTTSWYNPPKYTTSSYYNGGNGYNGGGGGYNPPQYTSSYYNGGSGYNGGYDDHPKYSYNTPSTSYYKPTYTSSSSYYKPTYTSSSSYYNGGNGYNGGSGGSQYTTSYYNGGYDDHPKYTYSTPSTSYYKPTYTSSSSYYKPTYTSSSSYYYKPTYTSSSSYYQPTYTSSPSYYKPTYTSSSSYYKPTYSTPSWEHSSSEENKYTSNYNDQHNTWYSSPKYEYTSTKPGYDYKPSTTSWYKPSTTTWYQPSSNDWEHDKGASTYDKGYNDKTYGTGYGDKSTYDYKPTTSASYYGGGSSGYGSGSGSGYDNKDKGYGYDNSYASSSGKVAGNLATEDDESDSGSNWKDKAKLYEIIIIVLASVLGVGIVGGIVGCFVTRRKKDEARPSAYRSIHDAEKQEPNAPLYGAEGGSSRYSDPYADSK